MRNFSLLSSGELAARAIAMFTNIIIARWLAPERYGEYALLLTYITLFQVVATLGLRHMVIRTIAINQDKSRYYFYIATLWRLIGYLFCIAVIYVYNLVNPLGYDTFFYFALLAGIFFESFLDNFQNVAFGMQRMEWTSIVNVSVSALTLLAYSVLPAGYIDITNIVIIFLAAALTKNILYYACLVKSRLLKGEASFGKIKREDSSYIIKNSFPYYILAIFTLFSSQFPIIFLKDNCGIQEVAYFNTANKLLLPLMLFLNTAMTALFPNQSILFAKDKAAFNGKAKQILTLLCILGVFCAAVISLFRSELVMLLYGNEYKATGNVMAYQCWYLVLYALFCFIGGTFGAANRQKLLATTSIVYAVVSAPILYWFSKHGAEGLSVGYLVASVVNMTYNYYYLNRVIDHALTKAFTFKLFSLIVLAFTLSNLVPESTPLYIKIILLLAMSGAAYLSKNRIIGLLKTN